MRKRVLILAAICMSAMYGIAFAFDGDDVVSGQYGVQQIEEEHIKANKEALTNAQTAMEQKDYNSAITYLTAYINGKTKKYEPYKMRGECYYALRQYGLAEKDFQTAIDIKTADDKFITGTKYVTAIVLGADKEEQKQNTELGNLYGLLMYAQKAQNKPYEASYTKAFEYNSHIFLPQPKKEEIAKINCPQKYGTILNPQGDDIYISQIVEDIKNGNFHEAGYKVPNLQNAYPDYYLTYYLTGVVMAGLEENENAIQAFEKAIRLNPNDFESYASIGQIYYDEAEKYLSKDWARKSLDYFDKAIALNPNCYIYHYYKGLNYLLSDDNESAINEFNSAIKFKEKDYNSMYYKLIAQFRNGNFNEVVDGTTKLLYRHVSNYNSVTYLRALANFELGKYSEAMSDVETVFNNMNDIYNSDIKNLSKKEQTLPEYLYYLKSQILRKENQGIKSDLKKAMANPIIKQVVNAVPTKIVVSAPDMDAQYDYIRTAFIDKDIVVEYNNADYVLSYNGEKPQKTVSNDEAIKEPSVTDESPISEHLASEDLMHSVSKQEVAMSKAMAVDEPSSAKDLAQSDGVSNLNTEAVQAHPEPEVKEKVNEVSQSQIQEPVDTVAVPESVKSAEQIEQVAEPVQTEDTQNAQISDGQQEKPVKKGSVVNEKYANVEGLAIVRNAKEEPIINSEDEVILLDLGKEESLAEKINKTVSVADETVKDVNLSGLTEVQTEPQVQDSVEQKEDEKSVDNVSDQAIEQPSAETPEKKETMEEVVEPQAEQAVQGEPEQTVKPEENSVSEQVQNIASEQNIDTSESPILKEKRKLFSRIRKKKVNDIEMVPEPETVDSTSEIQDENSLKLLQIEETDVQEQPKRPRKKFNWKFFKWRKKSADLPETSETGE